MTRPRDSSDPGIDEVRKRDMPGNPTGPDKPAPPAEGPDKKPVDPGPTS